MAKRPDLEEEETSVYDSASSRPKTDTSRGHDVATRSVSDDAATRSRPAPVSDDAATREMKPARVDPRVSDQIRAPLPFGTASDQIRLISMKTPGEIVEKKPEAAPPPVKLRSVAEFHSNTPPGGMGRLAPPRDEKEVRARRRRSFVGWAFAVLVIGGLVMAIVILLARR